MNFIKSGDSYTVVISNKVYTFDTSHKKYSELVDFIKADDYESFVDNYNIALPIVGWSSGNFRYAEGNLYFGNEIIDGVIVKIIQEMRQEGFSCEPLLNFLTKLYSNPSYHVVEQLYTWLEHMSLAITDKGTFLAYKSVSVYNGEPFVDCYGREVKAGDFVDSYTKKIRNNIGDINSMPRRLVNDNRDVGCSDGFHVGTMSYVTTQYSQDKVIICEVDPANVVSIPTDCSCQKIRCCEYTVVSEMTRELKIVEHNYKEEYYSGVSLSDHVDDEDFDDDDGDDDLCDGCDEPEDDCCCFEDDDEDDDTNLPWR